MILGLGKRLALNYTRESPSFTFDSGFSKSPSSSGIAWCKGENNTRGRQERISIDRYLTTHTSSYQRLGTQDDGGGDNDACCICPLDGYLLRFVNKVYAIWKTYLNDCHFF